MKHQRNEAHSDIRIGHVHLRVADLERATAFYRDVLGFAVTAYGPDFGLPGAAFLAAGGYHPHTGLNTRTNEGRTSPPSGHTGLHHLAVVYPGMGDIDGAEDHAAGRETGGVEAGPDLHQSESQMLQRDDPPQAQHVPGGVEPVPAHRAPRRHEKPDLLVVVQRAHR